MQLISSLVLVPSLLLFGVGEVEPCINYTCSKDNLVPVVFATSCIPPWQLTPNPYSRECPPRPGAIVVPEGGLRCHYQEEALGIVVVVGVYHVEPAGGRVRGAVVPRAGLVGRNLCTECREKTIFPRCPAYVVCKRRPTLCWVQRGLNFLKNLLCTFLFYVFLERIK